MAANKFATMLHRNTNRITLILIYAVLEWILILLLLFHSLFSYLIIKFADFFGLQPPCPWCTRLDRVFDPQKDNKNMLCEVHAEEISKLVYCSSHKKLAESQDMCEHCLSSRPEFQGFSKMCSLFPWIKEFGVIQNHTEKVAENGEVSFECSCCGLRLDNTYILLKTSSWECAHKVNNYIHEGSDSDEKISDFAADLYDNEKVLEDKNEREVMLSELDESVQLTEKEIEDNPLISIFGIEMKEFQGGEDKMEDVVWEKFQDLKQQETLIMEDKSVQACVEEDAPLEISPRHLEFSLDYSGQNLVPVELVVLIAEETHNKDNVKMEDYDMIKEQSSSKFCEVQVQEKEDSAAEHKNGLDEMEVDLDFDINEEPKFAMLDSMELEEDENSFVFHAKDCNFAMEELEQFTKFPGSQFSAEDVCDVQELAIAAREMHLDVHTAFEELSQIDNNETEADVSIGTDIPDLDMTNELENQESVDPYQCTHEDPSTSSGNLDEADDHGPMRVKEQMVELQCLSAQDSEHMLNNQPSFQLELNEIGEDKVPDTPMSVEGLDQLPEKLVFLAKRDSEESLDGTVMSELEDSVGVVTIESLKSALRAERKNLHALYAELEEERSASAVAADQTMAMISRLQEEKATMKMEALQYQRMMEEQSEYDQDALELMTELMVKREKDKQELEQELEVYREKLLHYETKEKISVFKKSNGSTRRGFSSASCGNAEDSDGLLMNLEESLADFEEERLSILSQLKVLEEKLMILDDEKEQQFEDIKANEDFHEENGNHGDKNAHFNGEANGHANGFVKEMKGKHHQQRKLACQTGKSLLPLFEAISNENGDMMSNGNENGYNSNGVHNSSISEKKKLAIEEGVNKLYERLKALEANTEFIKHCVGSLRKDDKGMELLQEILQHLCDLRNLDLHVRNLSGSSLV